MKKLPLLLACIFSFAVIAQADPIEFGTTLSGAAEVPANASPGTGTAIVIYDPTAHSLRVEVTFLGLLSGSTASHIHCCAPPGSNAGVATQVPTFTGFPLGVTSGTYDNIFDLTLASSWNPAFITANDGTAAGAEAAFAAGLSAGDAYLNIHTAMFPAGEIRGWLVPVPEPASLSLLSAGLIAAFARKRLTASKQPN